MVDCSLINLKQYCIRLIAQHDGLSYYCDYVFGIVEWEYCIVVFWVAVTVYDMDNFRFHT
jgi:hypothetical protein